MMKSTTSWSVASSPCKMNRIIQKGHFSPLLQRNKWCRRYLSACISSSVRAKRDISRFNSLSTAVFIASITMGKFSSDKHRLNIEKVKGRVMTMGVLTINTGTQSKLRQMPLKKTTNFGISKCWNNIKTWKVQQMACFQSSIFKEEYYWLQSFFFSITVLLKINTSFLQKIYSSSALFIFLLIKPLVSCFCIKNRKLIEQNGMLVK